MTAVNAADSAPDKYRALTELAARYHAGEFPAAQYAARYVLLWQFLRYGNRLAQRRSHRDPRPDGAVWWAQLEALPRADAAARLAELLERYDLREVRRRVNIALVGWLRGAWQLTLCEHVPDTREVLRMQTRGTRPVTLIADYPRLLAPVHDKADAFAFVCHDLEHAWQFFHDPTQHIAQRQFAQRLDRAIEQGTFATYVADPVFAEKFAYLAADMNTHVMHSLQYLRAILLEFYLRAEGKATHERLSAAARVAIDRCLAGLCDGVPADDVLTFLPALG
ncbi:MAG: hypothetical protein HY308_07000 [Gammaproteobacteria bacterium]|nr:hypothetical protein [Gammaproteobacteria bacterium]